MIRSFLASTLLRLISLFPLSVAHALGRVLGRSFYKTNNELKKVTRKNIQLCFPDFNERERDDVVRESLKQTGMAMTECGALWLWPSKRVMRLVREVTGQDLLTKAMSEGGGVILVMPHLGAWEVIALYSSQLYTMTSLYRPPKLEHMGHLVRKGRERMGATLVPTDSIGVRALRKALRNGELVGILPDQDPGKGSGVFAPFFGIQANTMTLLSRLASKTGAKVLIGYAERLPKGQGYHIHYAMAPECLADDDPVDAATCLNDLIEKYARELPVQYQWGYKRFKTRPEGEPKRYRKSK